CEHTVMRFLFFCRIYSAEKKNLQRQNLFYLKNRTFTITFIDYHYTSATPWREAARANGKGYASEKADFGATHVQSGTDLVGRRFHYKFRHETR
ncbi:MAG: hypothetical protein IKX40_07845, partial [Thermoguttaceae bacterium]|nr:hypothetical protein [Thermoguttaceae bacterium]